jgi:iron complex outermembrane receptor protein
MIANRIAMLLVLATTAATGWARDVPPPALPKVAVTATIEDGGDAIARPESSIRLDRDRLRQAGPRIDLAEVLASVPGVVANPRWNFAQDTQLSIRGHGARATFGVRGVRLYVNGIPATAADGQGQIGHAPLAAASAVEVIRGPLAALHGNAAGGVVKVEVDPLAPSSAGLGGAASADGGRAGLVLGRASGESGVRAEASRFRTDGFRPHSATERRQFNAVAATRLADRWRLDASAAALDVPRAEDPLGLTPAEFARDPMSTNPAAIAFDTRERARQRELGLALRRDGDGLEPALRVAGYAGRREVDGFLAIPVAAQSSPLSGGGANAIARDIGGVEARVDWRAGPALLTVGLNHDRLDEDRRGFENFVGGTLGVRGRLRRDESNTVRSTDALAKAEIDLGPGWLAIAGLRGSRVRFESRDRFVTATNPDDSGARTWTATVPALGFVHAPSPELAWRASVARGFETPTVIELSYRPDGAAGVNFELEPARTRQHELGVRYRPGPWSIDLALFRDLGRGEVVVARSEGGRAAFRNAGRTRREGAELALGWDPGGAWSLDLAATVLDARYAETVPPCRLPPCPPGAQGLEAGRRLPGIPPRQLLATLTWRPSDAWRAWASLAARDAIPVDDRNGTSAPGHARIDVGLARTVALASGEFDLTLRIDNAIDRALVGSVIVNDGNGRWFEPAPPRRLWLEAEWRW